MERRQFDHAVDQLKNLTKRQREKLVAMLTEGLKRDRTEELIEQAVRQRLKCPRCGTSELYRHRPGR
jgi:ribosomal protein S27AE